jgi:hypothetical protein
MAARFYECKVELPALDGDGVEAVVLLLQPITKVPVGVLRRHRHDREQQMWDIFDWGVSPDQMDLFERVPSDQIEGIMAGWQEAGDGVEAGGGVTVGESEASSTSSTGTGRRSKQTSSETGSG